MLSKNANITIIYCCSQIHTDHELSTFKPNNSLTTLSANSCPILPITNNTVFFFQIFFMPKLISSHFPCFAILYLQMNIFVTGK